MIDIIKMTDEEKFDLDALEQIIEDYPEIEEELLAGTLGEHFRNLVHKRNCEQQEAFEQQIASSLAEEITKQIDKDIIQTMMGDFNNVIAKATAIPSSILHPNKWQKVEPDPEFNDNDPQLIGAKSWAHSQTQIVQNLDELNLIQLWQSPLCAPPKLLIPSQSMILTDLSQLN